MPSQSTDAAIRARVEAFVDELTDLIREAALDAVQEALVRDGAAAPARKLAGPRRKKAGRRRRAAVDTAKVLAAIQAHAGQRTEVIAKSMGTDSKALKPAIDELVAGGQVTRKGKARGTTLHPTGKSASAPAAKKPAARKKRGKKRAKKKPARR